MDAGQGSKVEAGNAVARCPRCMCRQLTGTASVTCGAEVLVARCCPGCGHRDTVVTAVSPLRYRQDARTMRGLQRLAESLSHARARAVVDPSGTDGDSCG
jgi:hypothetical protein